MHVNCYPLIFKLRVVECYYSKRYTINILLSIFAISRSSLYNWIRLWKLGNLHKKEHYQKDSKYTSDVKKYICDYVTTKVNFDYKKLIRLINKKFSITSHKSSIYSILKDKNITRKRINIKTNLSKKQKTKCDISKISKYVKSVGIENIISIDESSFDTHINSYYGWNIKGESLIVKKVKPRIRYSIISAISIKKVIDVKIVKGSVNGTIFINFIKGIITKLRSDKVLFMDNARIHHSKLFTAYAKTIENRILYNVPYCSELNPIEHVFSKVKSIVHKRNNNEIASKLHRNIRYGFAKITRENLKGYYANSLTF